MEETYDSDEAVTCIFMTYKLFFEKIGSENMR